jgi:hypothetical protein
MQYYIGDIVKINRPFMGEPAGTKAFVYEEYDFGEGHGVSLITENGEDLGGFSEEEQKNFLEKVGKSSLNYEFVSVMRLANDFRQGYFAEAFAEFK